MQPKPTPLVVAAAANALASRLDAWTMLAASYHPRPPSGTLRRWKLRRLRNAKRDERPRARAKFGTRCAVPRTRADASGRTLGLRPAPRPRERQHKNCRSVRAQRALEKILLSRRDARASGAAAYACLEREISLDGTKPKVRRSTMPPFARSAPFRKIWHSAESKKTQKSRESRLLGRYQRGACGGLPTSACGVDGRCCRAACGRGTVPRAARTRLCKSTHALCS